MPSNPFPKRALTIPEQIELFTTRGLIIDNVATATHYLGFIGYFRLKEYARFFEHPNAGIDLQNHHLKAGTTFQDVLSLYIFDRELRIHVMDGLERIEVALRSIVSNTMCEAFGAHWFLEPGHFSTPEYHQSLLALATDEAGKYAQGEKRQGLARFLVHYFDGKYDEPLPPSWMLCEVLSFTTWSKIYQNLIDGKIQKQIAMKFQLPPIFFGSWLHALTHLRNICAHHNCCWNRKFTITPYAPKIDGAEIKQANSFYAYAFFVHRFLRPIAPGSTWTGRLKSLFDAHPRIPIEAMGFPAGWHEKASWR